MSCKNRQVGLYIKETPHTTLRNVFFLTKKPSGSPYFHVNLQASQASATDLRLWSSYVQLLALLGNRQEATKVAEKALSMVQVKFTLFAPAIAQ